MPAATQLHNAIARAVDPMALMRRVVDQALRLVEGADGAVVELLDDGHLEYVCVAGSLAGHAGLRLPAERSLSGQAAESRMVLRCDDAELDPRVDAVACRRTGIRSMLCVPLVHADQGIGVLKVSSSLPHSFADDDVETLAELAAFIGVTVGAAADLAQVTAELLGPALATPAGAVAKSSTSTSQFVANVLTPGMVEGVEIAERIQDLLDTSAFVTVAQPIVDLAVGTVVGVEALTRFQGLPSRPPDVWFAEAHSVGLGVDLELAAAASAMRLCPALPEHLYVAINVGPAAIRDRRMHDILTAGDLARVVLEITEHEEVDDYETLRYDLAPLREAGARLAIDDTGAGFASLAHILRLAPDIIKLDRVLTHGIDLDPVRRALAAALVTFAADTGAMITAEGIETVGEATALLGMGIPYGQGYYLARPGPVEQVPLQASRPPTRGVAGPSRH